MQGVILELKLALIGKSIGHSQSSAIYRSLLPNVKLQYDLLDYKSGSDIPSLRSLIESYNGISVTAPYKKNFDNQIDIFSAHAQLAGSINCIKCNAERKIVATNTDWLALNEIFNQKMNLHDFDSVIVLGSGAMAQMTKRLIHHCSITFLDRKTVPDFYNHDYSQYGHKILIINSCSRNFQFCSSLSKHQKILFYDYNYSMKAHEDYFNQFPNVQYVSGMELLRLQAVFALQFWGLFDC